MRKIVVSIQFGRPLLVSPPRYLSPAHSCRYLWSCARNFSGPNKNNSAQHHIAIYLLNCDMIEISKWRIKNVNRWVCAPACSKWTRRSLPFIHLSFFYSSPSSSSSPSSVAGYFFFIVSAAACQPDPRFTSTQFALNNESRLCMPSMCRASDVGIDFYARLQKYVRNKYFKLSCKSKTVNGMMYAPAFIPHSRHQPIAFKCMRLTHAHSQQKPRRWFQL